MPWKRVEKHAAAAVHGCTAKRNVPVLRVNQRKSAAHHHGKAPVLRVKPYKSAADHRF